MGRLVINHSTYIKGLIEWLKILAKEDKVKTITPGVICKVVGKRELLSIYISRKTNEGYKLIARKGWSLQEIFIISELSKEELEQKIERSNPVVKKKRKRKNSF